MPSPAPRSLLRRLVRWTLWTLASVIALGVAAAAYVTFFGVTLDASLLRGNIARTFSDNIGRPVRLDGPMQLEISARPKLRVGGLHIANPPGFAGGDFASLGEARLALDLWPLLFEKRLQIEELAGADVRIRLQRRADGANNWTFALPAKPARKVTPAASTAPAISAEQAVTLLDIQRVTLEKLNVEYTGADGKSHYFDLHSAVARAQAGQPFGMTLTGAVEKSFSYKVEFIGGRLPDLLATGKPWPIDLTLTFLSSTLKLDGTIAGATGDIRFGLGTETLGELERLFQMQLPQLGPTAIAGRVEFRPGKVTVSNIAGVMGDTTLIGDLDFDSTGARPRVSGALSIPSLDLRPFLAKRQTDARELVARMAAPPRSLADTYRELSQASFSLGQLNGIDADLTLRVGNWLSLPGEVREASLRVKLDNGRLDVPIQATITGVTLAGAVRADASATPPKFSLSLATGDSELGGLAELLVGLRGLKGHLGRFELRVAAKGDQVSELVQSLDVRLDIDRGRMSYGNVEGGRPVEFVLDKLSVALPPGKALEGSLRGALLGEPFSASVHGGKLEPMMLEGRSAIDFNLRSEQLRARVHGTLEPPTLERGPEIRFEMTAPRATAAASWLGFAPQAEAAFNLAGKIALRRDDWRLENLRFQVGRSSLTADLARTAVGAKPLIKVRLAADNIDVKEIESLIPKSEKKAGGRPVLDIPILPRGIDLTDADIEVRVKRFAGSPLDVQDVSFDGRIREGYMHPSPFAVNVAATAFTGAVLLDLRGEEPSAGLWLYAGDIDVGALLRKLGVVANLDATFREFGVNLVARSSRLGDMLARSELLGQFDGGRITLRDPNTKAQARITLEKGELRAEPGAPLKLNLAGALDDNPVTISLQTARADELVNPKLSLPFTLNAEAAETKVQLTGTIARPIGSQLELALSMQGPRFETLNKIARASLPPWGPWSAQGRFLMSPQGYAVNDLRLQIADSVLNGEGRLDTTGARPRLDVALTAPNIQLDNFRFGDWSPVAKKPADEKEKPLTQEEMRRKAAEASQQAQQLLSPEVLRRQDAYLKVQVEQVLSGADQLGSGRLEAKLENGRADIGPVEVNVPGGSAKLSLGYEPTEREVKVDLHIGVEKLDYGILARRIKPDTDLQGSFSVKMDVESRAQYLSDILKHGNGRIDFAVWPQNMKSGIFDMWAVNVLVALVPAVDPGKASKVNCAIGRFQLEDGKLTDRAIVLDTSRMRVTGKGGADFGTEKVSLTMRPQAKTAQFLSLATPIRVSGTFQKFEVGVAPGGSIETVARLATSILWVPLQKLGGKKIPADGSDVCVSPWAAGG